MVSFIGGIVRRRLADPLLAHDPAAVPDAAVQVQAADFRQVLHGQRNAAVGLRDAAPVRGAFNPGTGYWIGNQHDIHTPYLFNHADRADLTQKWVRWTLQDRFSADPDGLDGNDDGGTLSAWYVFSAMGFYPIAGSDRYWIGSPCIENAAVSLDGGNTLTVRVQNQGKKNLYVSAVTLNGEPLTAPFLTHDQIAAGGMLVFTMTNDARACAF